MADTWVVSYTGIRCRLDVNKSDRYVSKTADMEKVTHILMGNYPLPVTPNTKDNQIQVNGINYRLISYDPEYLLLSTPDHWVMSLLKVS